MTESKPNPVGDLIIFILILVGLGVLWFATGGPERAKSGSASSLFISSYAPAGSKRSGFQPIGSSYNNSADSQTGGNFARGATSTWHGKIRLRRGSAVNVNYAFQEYIYIDNVTSGQSAATATISGWQIKNRGRFTGYPDYAVIPSGVKIFIGGSSNQLLAPIRLGPKERAIVNTGRMVSSDPYQLPTAFQVNKCTGYLLTAGSYDFYPAVNRACDYADREPGAQETLNDDCLAFVKKEIKPCLTAKFNDGGSLIGLGKEVVNDREGKKRVIRLDQSCLTFLRNHYNYNSCVTVHKNEANFFSKDWRVWLGRTNKLYAPNREIITLLDSRGKIVDQISY